MPFDLSTARPIGALPATPRFDLSTAQPVHSGTSERLAPPFDPEGTGYDYETAIKYGIQPDETGHWPSRVPETGQLLKGRGHETFYKTLEGEKAQGNVISKGADGKYYSFPESERIEPSQSVNKFANVPEVLSYRPASLTSPESPLPREVSMESATVPDTGGRKLGLGSREMIEGAAGLPLTLLDVKTIIQNYGIRGFNKLFGTDITENQLESKEFQDWLDQLGFPNEQTKGERISGDVIRSVAGGMVFPIAGKALGGASSANALVRSLSEAPMTQLASAAASGAASGTVREAGGTPLQQVGAGLFAGLALPLAKYALPAATKGISRGISPESVIENKAIFESAGSAPTAGQATARRWVQALESGLSKTPGSAGVMTEAATDQQANIGEAARILANELTQAPSGTKAGMAIKQGVKLFKDAFHKKAEDLMEFINERIPADLPANTDNTLKAFDDLSSQIPKMGKTSEALTHPYIKKMAKAFRGDINAAIDTQQSKVNEIIAKMGDVQGQIDDITQKIINAESIKGKDFVSFGQFENPPSLALEKLNAQKKWLLERFNETLPKYLAQEQATLAGIQSGQAPYEALKQIRTRIGYLLKSSSLVSDVPTGQLKQIYGALSEDMRSAAESVGMGQAWKRFNQFYRVGSEQLEFLDKIVDQKTFNKIFQVATESGDMREGAQVLNTVLKRIPKENQKSVMAAFLNRLGLATPGRQNELGELFSTETFLTNWSKLNGAAKNVIASRLGLNYRKNLDAIVKASAIIRQGNKVFANPSGTQPALALNQTVFGGVKALLTGAVKTAWVGSVVGPATSYGTAKLMTNPEFVAWLARSTRTPIESMPIMLNQLAQQNKKNQDIQNFVKKAIEETNFSY